MTTAPIVTPPGPRDARRRAGSGPMAGRSKEQLLDTLSAALTSARPRRHAEQMAAVYRGDMSVVQVLMGEEAPLRIWPLIYLYAEAATDVAGLDLAFGETAILMTAPFHPCRNAY